MLVSDFDFDLPPECIAQEPRPRGSSRLLVVDRASGVFEDRHIQDLPARLAPGDRLVGNDSRVFPARLIGRRDPSGGAAECFLLEPTGDGTWDALVHPGQKLKPGARLVFERPAEAPGVRLDAEVLERRFFGRRRVRLSATGAATVDEAIDRLGHVPLPPYIHREDRVDDRERYQTVYARDRGSVAAPTAGLHFDQPLLAALRDRGVDWSTVTLHVGYGTFKPVRVDRVEAHAVDEERFVLTGEAVSAMAATRARGGRVVAVGTTTTRALEGAASEGTIRSGNGATRLFIHPGYTFRAIDGLLTNFHLPCSSLLMLVSAFAGRELVLDAYRHAIARGYRFYSYGDAMLIL